LAKRNGRGKWLELPELTAWKNPEYPPVAELANVRQYRWASRCGRTVPIRQLPRFLCNWPQKSGFFGNLVLAVEWFDNAGEIRAPTLNLER
jgi:hypothetical protein